MRHLIDTYIRAEDSEIISAFDDMSLIQLVVEQGPDAVKALPKGIRQWSLTTLREKLVKIGAKVTWHSKYVFFQLEEVAVPRRLFAAILERIGRLGIPTAVCRSG